MTIVPKPRRATLGVTALVVAVLATAVVWWVAVRDSHADVVQESSSRQGWQTIAYEGVRVEVPASWEPTDMDDCEFQFEHWAAPDSPACGRGGGVAFYGSATFDPATGPGVRRTTRDDEPAWGGYAYAGDYAVYAADDDRALVARVLASAH